LDILAEIVLNARKESLQIHAILIAGILVNLKVLLAIFIAINKNV
jgi:hypothetical protein